MGRRLSRRIDGRRVEIKAAWVAIRLTVRATGLRPGSVLGLDHVVAIFCGPRLPVRPEKLDQASRPFLSAFHFAQPNRDPRPSLRSVACAGGFSLCTPAGRPAA